PSTKPEPLSLRVPFGPRTRSSPSAGRRSPPRRTRSCRPLLPPSGGSRRPESRSSHDLVGLRRRTGPRWASRGVSRGKIPGLPGRGSSGWRRTGFPSRVGTDGRRRVARAARDGRRGPSRPLRSRRIPPTRGRTPRPRPRLGKTGPDSPPLGGRPPPAPASSGSRSSGRTFDPPSRRIRGSSSASDAEPATELLRNFAELDLRERIEIGDGRVFGEVLFLVDVRDDGGHGLLRQNELQGGLGQAHPFSF